MIRTTIKTIAALAVAVTLLQSATFANENVYDATIRSTAKIDAGHSTGTGVLVDYDNRLVVTNWHVCRDSVDVVVLFPEFRNGRAISETEHYRNNNGVRGKVVASEMGRDIAIIQIERIPEGITAVEFGEPARPGQNVHSIGNPGASDAMWIYTYGKVRQNYYRTGAYDFGMTQMQVLETDSPINPGDSGGPIVNDEGKLVGISQGHSRDSRMYSYGVDISEVTWYIKKYLRSSGNMSVDTTMTTSMDVDAENHASTLTDLFASDK